MASIKNDWVGYLDRSYQQIKSALIARLTTSNPEMTDHTESNPLIIFISMFAGVAEMLGFYIDNAAQESHIITAQRRSSIIKEALALDYRIKARHPEQVDLLITWNAAVAAPFTLQSGFRIQSQDGITYRLLADQNITAGATSSSIPLSEVTIITTTFTTNGQKNQKLNLGTNYRQSSLELSILGNDYTQVDTFANSSPTSRHFIVDIEADGNAYAILGDGINGELPTNGLTINAEYQTTLGAEGKVGAGKFNSTTIVVSGSLPGGVTIASANSLINSSGGTDYEDTEQIRTNAIRSIRTLNRMVTRDDHKFVMEAVAGVAKAAVSFNCGKFIDLYIVPDGGGVAQTTLLNEAQAEAEERKMVTTFPVVRPAGETRLVLGADVVAKKRKSLITTREQVEDALVAFGALDNQEINGAIRLSDLQALIDNQSNVDYVEITKLYTIPYARPLSHTNILNWVNKTLPASVAPVSWRLEYDGSVFRVFRDTIFQSNIAIGAEFSSAEFEFTISAGSYSAGNTYEFTVMPYLKNLELIDYTIFTILESDLAINVLPNPSI